MPHMDGQEAHRQLRKIDPDVCVIVSSGYNEQEVAQRFIGRGLAGFIQKPYQIETLRQALHQALHKPPETPSA
jgi:two-component system, cell cycle sensor histidine kinase and response regulator CckA